MDNTHERIKLLPNINRAKVIAGVGLLAGMILLITGLLMTRLYGYVGEALIFWYISAIVTIVWASIALFSSVILLRGKDIGYIFLLIAGIGGIIGNFIPIFSYDVGWGYIQIIYLNSTAAYIDLVLMLIGGIYGVALTERKER